MDWSATFAIAQVGDTTLPEQAPSDDDELSDELLQALHHVLMEVRPPLSPSQGSLAGGSLAGGTLADPRAAPPPPPSLRVLARADPHRGGRHGLPQLRAQLPDIQRHPQHGAAAPTPPSLKGPLGYAADPLNLLGCSCWPSTRSYDSLSPSLTSRQGPTTQPPSRTRKPHPAVADNFLVHPLRAAGLCWARSAFPTDPQRGLSARLGPRGRRRCRTSTRRPRARQRYVAGDRRARRSDAHGTGRRREERDAIHAKGTNGGSGEGGQS